MDSANVSQSAIRSDIRSVAIHFDVEIEFFVPPELTDLLAPDVIDAGQDAMFHTRPRPRHR